MYTSNNLRISVNFNQINKNNFNQYIEIIEIYKHLGYQSSVYFMTNYLIT